MNGYKIVIKKIKTVFGNSHTALARKQTPNLLRHLSKPNFTSNNFTQKKHPPKWTLPIRV